MRKKPLFIILVAFLVAAATQADVKFTRLAENQFIVHHRKLTVLGAEAKAMRTAVKEAASICVAAGFTHMELKDQNVGERMHGNALGGGRGASADLRIKLYTDPDEQAVDEKDLLDCAALADPKKVEVAKKKLERGDG